MSPGGGLKASSRWLRNASALLTFGSCLLLLAGLFVYSISFSSLGVFWIFYWLTLIGAMAHLVAWVVIYRALFTLPEPPSRERRALRRGFGYSILAFAISALTVPLQFAALFGFGFASVFFTFFFIYLWPYFPFVFAPIVLFHALLFSRSATPGPIPNGTAHRRYAFAKAGAAWLAATAILGVTGQAVVSAGVSVPTVLTFAIVFPLPAGLTAVGYGLELLAVSRREMEEVGAEEDVRDGRRSDW